MRNIYEHKGKKEGEREGKKDNFKGVEWNGWS